MKKLLYFLLSSFIMFQASSSMAQTIDPETLDGVLYVKVNNASSIALDVYAASNPAMRKLVDNYQITNIKVPFKTQNEALQKVYKVTFSSWNQADALIKEFGQFSFIEYAEKAPIYQLTDIPDDYVSNTQWSLTKINAPQAWNISTGSSHIKVAIVDNSVRGTHEDLIENRWVNPLEIPDNHVDDDMNGFIDDVYGFDVADEDNNPEPPANAVNTGNFTHGTHCAGIAASSTGNGTGIASIGHSVQFISVKCTPDSYTTNTLSESYAGVDYAIAANADIISMSFGSTHNYETWSVLIDAAVERGILLVAAAGNNNNEEMFYPASYGYVIAVGSTSQSDAKSSFSNYGAWVDVMAPGSSIYSTLPENGNTYGSLSGTSMACPMVAGLAALIKSTDPAMSVQKLRGLIMGGCENINNMNADYIGKIGAGRINAYNSLNNAMLGTDELSENAQSLQLYPNPNQGTFSLTVSALASGKSQLAVYNQLGQSVYQQEIGSGHNGETVAVQTEGLSQGMYTVRLTNGTSVQNTRMVVQ